MRAVAQQMGVSATALYRHYADKDQLMREVVRETAAIFRDYLGRALAHDDPWDRLLGLIVQARAYALDHPRYHELLFLIWREPAMRYPDDLRRQKTGAFPMLRHEVRACMAAGLLHQDDTLEVALTLGAHLQGLLRMWRIGRFGTDRPAFEAFADRSFARILAGLAPAAPR